MSLRIEESLIDTELFQSENTNVSGNFIGLAVLINNDNVVSHAGIIIHYLNNKYLFHYTGRDIELIPLPRGEWYFHKKTDVIPEDEIPMFYSICKHIKEKNKPSYGFSFNGNMYTQDGDFNAPDNFPQIFTCVSFCLSVISTPIEKNYLEFTDWDSTSVDDIKDYADSFIQRYIQENNLSEENADILISQIRRIKPSEYITSGYFNEAPIKKMQIDPNVGRVESTLLNMKLSNN